jgi:hypothetical protein
MHATYCQSQLYSVANERYVLGLSFSTYSIEPTKTSIERECEDTDISGYVKSPGRYFDEMTTLYDVGLVRNLKITRKMYSAAATLAAANWDLHRHAWSHVYDLGNGSFYWVGVLDGGSPAQYGDWVGERARVFALAEQFKTEFQIAYTEYSSGQLETHLMAAQATHKTAITPIERAASASAYGRYALLFILLLGIAGLIWQQIKPPAPPPKPAPSSIPSAALTPSVTLVAKATELMKVCQELFNTLPLVAAGGWQLTSLECSADGAVLNWTSGSSYSLRPSGDLLSDGRSIVTRRHWAKAIPQQQLKPLSISDMDSLRDVFEKVNVHLLMQMHEHTAEFSSHFTFPPWQLPLPLAELFIKRIVFTNNEWSLEGEALIK